ncbi:MULTISPECIES: DarT ssDNA thymidine ADP-ribosyltransferase family protein [unclassified Vibrio]|uniref:DarT ssDNA thymidine ADP-ribosyltransferase family protein n=1 Tax=unclassified Vibrio TaxID=2614977 RepID=UPI0012AA94F0|nr:MULTISPECIES: DarT ssDNA thymidine ADP-ribosyltransferase family protein [unclassified Vibrio]QFT39672.1 hypothetical protein FIU99_25130 [Vibrio sp. THAF64]QGM37821.1 hypothetical protein GGC04_26350 [Vibrio sp. THAF191d]QGN73164.1 hypothetical protein GGC03_25575 [Vibrio sp. THAF191c]
MSKKEIKEFVQELDIPYLVHFTHISNLESIIEKGILSRDAVNELDDVVINDKERHDRRTHSISASIAHPNDLMFYKYRDVDEDWVVIAIKRRVLWNSECMFFKHNAADGKMSALEDHEVKGLEALQALYEEIDGFDSRAEQQLEDFDPTDKQAEVLIENRVAVEDLLGVYVSNRMVKKKYKDLLGDVKIKIHLPDKGVYASRRYRRIYQ